MASCRPIVNRPSAGPRKILRLARYSCFHRIHLDITGNPLELRLVADEPIIALVLPERLPRVAEHSVTLPRGKPLERLHQPRNLHARSDQQMNVARHDDICVDLVVPQTLLPIANGVDNHSRNLWPPKV